MKLSQLIGLAAIGVFATVAHAQYQVIHYFSSALDAPAAPYGPLLIPEGRSGALVATARVQVANSITHHETAALRIMPSGAVSVVHRFKGAEIYGGLTLGRDGRYYGATVLGGTHGWGTVFKMTWDGKVQVLHNFTGGDEARPAAPPVQSLHGEFFGTTVGQGSRFHGVIYKIDSWGTYTVLHTFNGLDGDGANTPLVQGPDYWFYGVSETGGAIHYGTIFRVNATGEFQRLFVFDRDTYGAQPNTFIRGTDGNFYGTTYTGGRCNGTVFKMDPSHKVTVIHNFCGEPNDGEQPRGGLVQATDGNLYGTAAYGGFSLGGILFRLSTSGEFKMLHSFERATGWGPTTLIQHTNGALYGSAGGAQAGVIFRYNLGLPPFITYVDVYGAVGETVEVIGQGFTNDTKVFFHGVRAQITEVTPTYLRVVVPRGATTGLITATTTYGTLKSNRVFVVQP